MAVWTLFIVFCFAAARLAVRVRDRFYASLAKRVREKLGGGTAGLDASAYRGTLEARCHRLEAENNTLREQIKSEEKFRSRAEGEACELKLQLIRANIPLQLSMVCVAGIAGVAYIVGCLTPAAFSWLDRARDEAGRAARAHAPRDHDPAPAANPTMTHRVFAVRSLDPCTTRLRLCDRMDVLNADMRSYVLDLTTLWREDTWLRPYWAVEATSGGELPLIDALETFRRSDLLDPTLFKCLEEPRAGPPVLALY